MSNIDANTILANSPNMNAEMKNWQKWVTDLVELRNLQLSILCHYTEAFSVPFKFKDLLLNSYGNPDQRVAIRPEQAKRAIEEFDREFNQNRTVESVVSDHPDAFMFVPRGSKLNPAFSTNFSFDKKLPPSKIAKWFKDNFGFGDWEPGKVKTYIGYFNLAKDGKLKIGQTTGNIYVDIYGYIWLEMRSYYLEETGVLSWVRESSVDYEGKELYADFLLEIKNEIMAQRYGLEGNEDDKKKKRNLSLLSGALLLLNLNS